MSDQYTYQELAEKFEDRARQREAETPGDPAAHAIKWCAAQLRSTIQLLSSTDLWWSTERAALECGCSVAAVQYWCRNAERLGLRVVQKPSREYLIHRDDALKRKDSAARRMAG